MIRLLILENDFGIARTPVGRRERNLLMFRGIENY